MANTPINPITEASKAGLYPARRFGKRERKMVQSLENYTPATPSSWAVQPTTIQGAMDQLAAQGSGGLAKTVSVTWDFSVNGGAISTIPLATSLPAKAIITEVTTDVLTATTGTSGGTITLQTADSVSISGASTTPASTGPTLLNGSPLPIKTATSGAMQVVIATHALTAGKITWFIRYVQSA